MKVKFEKMGEERSGEGANGTWNVKTIVCTTLGEYPKMVAFTVFNDKVATNYQPGQELEVSYNLESREYNNKYYTDAKVWKIEDEPQQEPEQPIIGDSTNDMPF